jgi:crotonobetainyl-CoA:carnitine CoA-transferase CaiB-like acyl-CoA transferase
LERDLDGKAAGKTPLINYKVQKQAVATPPVPFSVTNDKRPLAGIKIIELARVIAAPAAGAALTSFGADVVRIQSPNLPDPNVSSSRIRRNIIADFGT